MAFARASNAGRYLAGVVKTLVRPAARAGRVDGQGSTEAASLGGRLRAHKFELSMLALLLLTFAAIALEERLMVHEVKLAPEPAWPVQVNLHSDQAMGGKSSIAPDPRRAWSWRCELKPGYDYPYCSIELHFDPQWRGEGIDLSGMERISLSYAYSGRGESLRVNLKHHDERYGKRGLAAPVRFNTAEFEVRSDRRVAELYPEDFSVPEWWMEENNIAPEDGRPDFHNVVAFEIQTGTNAPLGQHEIALTSITLHGRYLTRAEFYQAWLGVWAAALGLFLVRRILVTRTALRREAEARQKAEAHLGVVMRQDPLTGLLNRHALSERASADLAVIEEEGATGAVCLIQLGKLRRTNEVIGHAAGDELLIEMSVRLRNAFGEAAPLGRIAGDDFVAFARSEAPLSREFASALVAELNQPFLYQGMELQPSASLGIAQFPGDGSTYSELLRAADLALRQAIEAPDQKYRFYDPALRGGASARIETLAGRQRTPLSRIETPTFVAHARTDLSIREGCRIAAAWPGRIALSLKLSASEWQEEWTAERILTQLELQKFPASRLVLELSEDVFLARAGATLKNLETLRKAGVRLSLTEFRNGFRPSAAATEFDVIRVAMPHLTATLSSGEKGFFEHRGRSAA